jgi:hypothetical protein
MTPTITQGCQNRISKIKDTATANPAAACQISLNPGTPRAPKPLSKNSRVERITRIMPIRRTKPESKPVFWNSQDLVTSVKNASGFGSGAKEWAIRNKLKIVCNMTRILLSLLLFEALCEKDVPRNF